MIPTGKLRSERSRTQKNDRTARAEAEINRILAAEDELIPSSGFLAAVMERVAEEAAAPPPLAFPWKRAIPGILLAAAVFAWGAVEFVRLGLPALAPAPLALPHLSAASVALVESAGWVAFALGASLLSWLLARRLAGSGGLL